MVCDLQAECLLLQVILAEVRALEIRPARLFPQETPINLLGQDVQVF